MKKSREKLSSCACGDHPRWIKVFGLYWLKCSCGKTTPAYGNPEMAGRYWNSIARYLNEKA